MQPGDPEYEKLKCSLDEFGYIDPVIWNKRTGNVVGGHQRLKVLQQEGISKLTASSSTWTPKGKSLNIALNKISGDWDTDKLALLITDLQGSDFDVSLTGFDPAELDDLFKDDIKDGVHDDDFDVDAELKKPVFSKAGDMWQLGIHRLLCGDSTQPETYQRLLQGTPVNLVVTDPPYNVNYEGRAGKIKNDHLQNDKFYEFLLAAFTCMHTVMADDASIYVFHADTEGLNFRKAFSDAGFYLSGCCIWKKQSLVLGRSPTSGSTSRCFMVGRRKESTNGTPDGRNPLSGEFDKPKKNTDHPTMKPIPLLAYPILNSSMTGCTVLDPFGGSGSTLLACEQTKRRCYMIELDEKFCDVIVKRYIEQVGSDERVTVTRNGKTYTYTEMEAT